jgi:hypothetical protein
MRNREKQRFFSTKRIVWATLGLMGGMAVAIFHGALSAAGHVMVEQSDIIQDEIKVIRQRIESWILKRSD